MAFTFGGGAGGAGFGAPQQNAFNTPAPAFGANFGGQMNAQPFGAQAIGGAQGNFTTPAANQFAAPATGYAAPFGAQAAAQPFGVQGMGAAQGFGTPAGTQFGAAGAPFGQPAAASAFGAPGQQTGFGAAGYGAAAQGALGQAGMGGFAAAPAVGYAAQTFAPTFGQSSFAPATGGFAGANAFGAGAGAVAPVTFNGAGGSSFQTQNYSVQTNFSKHPVDKDGVGGIVNSICANQKDQSLESIRFLDYRNGNKGSAQPGFGGAAVTNADPTIFGSSPSNTGTSAATSA